MKSMIMTLLQVSLVFSLFSCGKKNESGKSNQWSLANPYGLGLTNINSPYSYGGVPLNQVMQQNPCRGGFNGYPGYTNQSYSGQRVAIQVPLVNFPSNVAPGDIFVGVTSYGDVAAVVGQAVGQPPLFVGYLCPRSFAPNGQAGLDRDIRIGAYSRCLFKPMTKATVYFPGGSTAEFRWLDGGSSAGQRFSFCSF